MKVLVQALLFLTWIAAYLGAVYGIGRYRQVRPGSLAGSGGGGYRADKDVGLWVAAFVAGVLLSFLAYLVT